MFPSGLCLPRADPSYPARYPYHYRPTIPSARFSLFFVSSSAALAPHDCCLSWSTKIRALASRRPHTPSGVHDDEEPLVSLSHHPALLLLLPPYHVPNTQNLTSQTTKASENVPTCVYIPSTPWDHTTSSIYHTATTTGYLSIHCSAGHYCHHRRKSMACAANCAGNIHFDVGR